MSGILKGFGLGDPYKSHEPSTCDLPGQALINNDERVLCTTQTSNGTYPRLARLSDGSILASFTRRQDNERVLRRCSASPRAPTAASASSTSAR